MVQTLLRCRSCNPDVGPPACLLLLLLLLPLQEGDMEAAEAVLQHAWEALDGGMHHHQVRRSTPGLHALH